MQEDAICIHSWQDFISLLEFFLGGSKKVVATFDVREKKLNIYNNSFEWEGKN